MRIVLIGAGNLMTSLSHALQGAGHDILQVFSRTSPSADSLAQVLQCEAVTDIHRLNRDADVYILAVKDSVLPTLAATIGASVGVAAYSWKCSDGCVCRACQALWRALSHADFL